MTHEKNTKQKERPQTQMMMRRSVDLIHPLLLGFLIIILLAQRVENRFLSIESTTSFGGEFHDYSDGAVVDSSGNMYIVGRFVGTAYFDTFSFTSVGASDVFFAKINDTTTMQIEWVKQAGGRTVDVSSGITLDSQENMLITGQFVGNPADNFLFDGEPLSYTTNGRGDIFIAKYAPDGTKIWVIHDGGICVDQSSAIVADHDDNVIVVGQYDPTTYVCTFQEGSITLTKYGGFDIFIAKYSNDSSFQWVVTAGGSLADTTKAVAVDSQNNIYVVGTFQGSANFSGEIVTSAGQEDTFIAKYMPDSSFEWVMTFGGPQSDIGYGVYVDDTDHIIVTGQFSGTATFDSQSIQAVGLSDLFLLTVNSSGALISLTSEGSAGGSTGGRAVTVDNYNNILVAGYFSDNITIGGNVLYSRGYEDILVIAYGNSGNNTATRAGGAYSDTPKSISCNSAGIIAISGSYMDTADFGPQNLTTNGDYGDSDPFLSVMALLELPVENSPSYSGQVSVQPSEVETTYSFLPDVSGTDIGTSPSSSLEIPLSSPSDFDPIYSTTILPMPSPSASVAESTVDIPSIATTILSSFLPQGSSDTSSSEPSLSHSTDPQLASDSHSNSYSNSYSDSYSGSTDVSQFPTADSSEGSATSDSNSNISVSSSIEITSSSSDCSGVNQCSGHGDCISTNVCHCRQPYFGEDCSDECIVQTSISGATSYQISRTIPVTIIADINSTCGDVSFQWQRIVQNDDPTLLTESISSKILSIPRFAFPAINYIYQFNFTAFSSSSGVRDFIIVSIHVITNDPVAVITSGNQQVSENSLVTLDGSSSYYEDGGLKYGSGVSERANYTWKCSMLNVSSTGSCPILPSTPIVQFKLNTAGHYLFTLVFDIDGKTSSTSAYIQTISSVMPTAFIRATQPIIVNSQKKLGLVSKIESGVSLDAYNLMWEAYLQSGDNRTLVPLGTDQLLNPSLSDPNIIIRPGVLLPGETYIFRFTITDRNDPNQTAFSEISRVISDVPTSGSFSVIPANGNELETGFKLEAASWKSDSSLLYRFEMFDGNRNRWVSMTSFSTSYSIVSTLPAGVNKVRVRVTNRYGGETVKEQRVVVYPSLSPSNAIQNNYMQVVDLVSQGVPVSGYVEALLSSIVYSLPLANNQTKGTIISGILQILDQSPNEPIAINMLNALAYNNLNQSQAETVLFLLKKTFELGPTDGDISQYFSCLAKILPSAIDEDQSSSELAVNLAVSIASSMLQSQVPGEFPAQLRDDGLQLSVVSDSPESLVGALLPGSDSVFIPESIKTVLQEGGTGAPVGIIFLSYDDTNPYSWAATNRSLASSVYVLKFMNSNGEQIPVTHLSSPIIITFERKETPVVLDDVREVVQCQYWDEEDQTQTNWENDGCHFAYMNSSHIVCHCNHTTSFAAFIEYIPVNYNETGYENMSNLQKGMTLTAVIVNGLIICMAIPLLITLFFLRNTQPLKSRFVGPYIGLFAVLTECIIQGVLRNALLLSHKDSDRLAVNIAGYLVMVLVNPLSLLAWFLFIWQQLRYFMHQHIYDAMKRNTEMTNRFARILVSKISYVSAVLAIVTISFLYFVLWLVLRVTSVLGSHTTIMIEVISYSSASIVFGIIVIATFIWDAFFSEISRNDRKAFVRMLERNIDKITWKEKAKDYLGVVAHYFTDSDPLYFRLESVFMVLTVLVSVVSYALGITMVAISSQNTALTVIQFIFDILYLVFRVFVFGGFVTIVTAHQFISARTAWTSSSSQEDEDPNTANMIKNFLKTERGYQIFHEFCIREFSLENLLLWKDLEHLKPSLLSVSPSRRSAEIKSLKEKYLDYGASFEVNIPNDVRQRFLNLCARSDHCITKEAEDALTDLCNAVMHNICDTWPRFAKTKAYQNHATAAAIRRKLSQ